MLNQQRCSRALASNAQPGHDCRGALGLESRACPWPGTMANPATACSDLGQQPVFPGDSHQAVHCGRRCYGSSTGSQSPCWMEAVVSLGDPWEPHMQEEDRPSAAGLQAPHRGVTLGLIQNQAPTPARSYHQGYLLPDAAPGRRVWRQHWPS